MNPVSRTLGIVFLASLSVEGIRFLLYRGEYEAHPYLWFVVGGAILFNIAYHRWLLPETYAKTVASAAFTQPGLPAIAFLIWKIVVLVVRTLVVSPAPTS